MLRERDIVRRDEPRLMAQHVWALVHGVAMLVIDDRLAEKGAVDTLLRYALERLRTGIAGTAASTL